MGEIIAAQTKDLSLDIQHQQEKKKKKVGVEFCGPVTPTLGGGNKDKDQLGLMLASGAKPHQAPDLVREILS